MTTHDISWAALKKLFALFNQDKMSSDIFIREADKICNLDVDEVILVWRAFDIAREAWKPRTAS
jgi:hypothetical protein